VSVLRSGPRSVRVTARSKRCLAGHRALHEVTPRTDNAIGDAVVTVPRRNREGNSAGVGGARPLRPRPEDDDDPTAYPRRRGRCRAGDINARATRGVKNRSRNDSCIRSWTRPR